MQDSFSGLREAQNHVLEHVAGVYPPVPALYTTVIGCYPSRNNIKELYMVQDAIPSGRFTDMPVVSQPCSGPAPCPFLQDAKYDANSKPVPRRRCRSSIPASLTPLCTQINVSRVLATTVSGASEICLSIAVGIQVAHQLDHSGAYHQDVEDGMGAPEIEFARIPAFGKPGL